ncbi:MAG: 6-phosphogluconolactonase [Candidatus Eisenbacteria bacterium]|uniref:6-phosphogluconolactonase n=1 Tax=Eiseniibacteriota bacterium TaxID=2212470 RepID=A0A933SER9_UNCEI|nr:6-phosphogluconolactonase [Candidatus Eisenbacteria bacterium]
MRGSEPRVRVVADAPALAAAAADVFAERAERAIEDRGEFRVALPGGRSVRGMLERLAAPPLADTIEWPRVVVFFADERAVPPSHPDSNHRLVSEALLAPLGPLAPRCERMRGEVADLAAEAHDYAVLLEEPLDLVVLGLGEDGHVASLFPSSPLLGEMDSRVAAVMDSPKPPAQRLTLTPRTLSEARALLVLASGSSKAEAVRAGLEERGAVAATPARLARDPRGEWLLDAEAAALLARD